MLIRAARRGVTLVAMVILLGEIVLQIAAFFVHDREHEGAGGEAQRRVVCVGDSHTYGALVPVAESYPAQLQRLLDARAPGQFGVVNLGVPGYNTALARARLQAALARYRPEVVVVWVGVNDSWNRTATGGSTWLARLDAVATQHVRVYRLVRTRLHDRALERALARPSGSRPSTEEVHDVAYDRAPAQVDRAIEDQLLAAYQGMVDDTGAARARIVFVAYPSETDAFGPPNRALRRLWAATGVTVVDTWAAVQRVPSTQRQMLWAGHPNGPMYAEIAADIAPAVVDSHTPTVPAPGLLARLGSKLDDASARLAVSVHGACPHDAGPYRWSPNGGVCFLERPLAVATPSASLSARFRIGDLPSGTPRWGGYNILGLFEPIFGTGVYVQVVPPDRLRLFTLGAELGACGPLDDTLRPGAWYRVDVTAEDKGASSPVHLALTDEASGHRHDVSCKATPTGGGAFSRLRVGSADEGAVGMVEIDDVAVHLMPLPAP